MFAEARPRACVSADACTLLSHPRKRCLPTRRALACGAWAWLRGPGPCLHPAFAPPTKKKPTSFRLVPTEPLSPAEAALLP